MQNDWVLERDLSRAGTRLFCLPHAGSGSAGFYRWKRMLTGVNVCPVHLPGRDMRRDQSARPEGTALVKDLHLATYQLLDRPYAIFGHSMGALLSFCWAQQIQAAGLRLPEAVVLSGRAPHPSAGTSMAPWLRGDDDLLLRHLDERFGGNSHAMLQDPELRAAFLPLIRADLQVVESLTIAGPPLDVPVFAICGDADPTVNVAEMRKWQSFAFGSFATKTFSGGHFYHLGEGEPALLSWLSETIAPSISPTT